MKKVTLLILIVFCFGFASPHHKIIARKNAAGGGDYSDITHFYTFETTGSPYFGANDCSDEDETPVFNSDWANGNTYTKIGSNTGYTSSGDAGYDFIHWSGFSTGTDVGSMRVGFWYLCHTYVYEGSICVLKEGGNTWTLVSKSGVDLYLKWTGTNTQIDTNLSVDTWYFIEIAVDETANTITFYVNGVQKGQIAESFSAGDLTDFYLGCIDTGDQVEAFDNLMISTDPTRDFCGLDGTCVGLADDTSKPTGACDG